MRYRLALLLAALPGLAAAQRQRPAARGAASITAADVQRRIGISADDSMLGRATPSSQLDAVAAYVAGEFQRFGLKPGGDSGTYFQHYPLEVLRFDPESSIVRITGRTPGIWRAGQDVLLVEGQPPPGAAAAPGRPTPRGSSPDRRHAATGCPRAGAPACVGSQHDRNSRGQRRDAEEGIHPVHRAHGSYRHAERRGGLRTPGR